MKSNHFNTALSNGDMFSEASVEVQLRVTIPYLPVQISALPLLTRLPATLSWKAENNGSNTWVPATYGGDLMEFQIPGSGLDQPQLWWAFGE